MATRLVLEDGVGQLDFQCRTNQFFNPELQLVNADNSFVDLTGSTVKSQCRSANGTLIADINVSISDYANGKIQYAQDYSTIPASQPGNDYVQDLVITDSAGEPWAIFAGKLRLTQGVTQ